MRERYYRRPKPPRKLRRLVFLLACLILILALAYAVSMVRNLQSFHNREDWAQQLRQQGPEGETVYLVYGVDYWGASPYVERLVLLYRDADHLKVLYIPGNTLIDQAALGQLYRRGESAGFIQALQDYLQLPVHHYLQIHYQGLVELEGLWGKIAVSDLPGARPELVPEDRPGLGGFELYHYFVTAGFRETPLEHLERQRQVLLTLWNKLNRRRIWGRSRLFKALSPYLETDLSWRELLALHEELAEHPFSAVEVFHLPGKEEVQQGRLYWAVGSQELSRLGSLLRGEGPVVAEIRVEVLNGSGIAGQAAGVAKMLTGEGLQVVNTGNADHFSYETTEVISLGETIETARAVSAYIPGAVISHQPVAEAKADVQVIVGQDFKLEDTQN